MVTGPIASYGSLAIRAGGLSAARKPCLTLLEDRGKRTQLGQARARALELRRPNKGRFAGTLQNLPGGSYSLHAHYGGDVMFAPSDSAPVRMKVLPENSVITVQPWTVELFFPVPIPWTGDPLEYGRPIGLQISVAGKSAPHRRHIEGILKRGIERAAPANAPPVPRAVAKHEHVRGSSYYDTENDNDTR